MAVMLPAEQKVDEFLGFLSIEKGYSKNTLSAYRRDLLRFMRFLSQNKVDTVKNIRRTHISEFMFSEKDRGLAASSISSMFDETGILPNI